MKSRIILKCRCKTYGQCGNPVKKAGDKCEYCLNGHQKVDK